MPPETTSESRKTRQEKIEEFLLDPDKAIFENIDELANALVTLAERLEDVDLSQLEQLQGRDGDTPQKGVDYFTEEELAQIEAFILERMPKEDVDFPSLAAAQKAIREQINDTFERMRPRLKGDPGRNGEDGQNGRDGSPDSEEEVGRKIKALKGNKRIGFPNIKGGTKVVRQVNYNSDAIEQLKKDLAQKMVALANPHVDGGGATGDMASNVYDPQNIVGDAFLRSNHTGQQLASTISNFDSAVAANTAVADNTSARHTHSNKSYLDTLSDEKIQDLIAQMFQGGTHTNASITYDDQNGTLNITATGDGSGSSTSKEEVEDFVGGLVTQGTGINVTYDDAGNVLTIALSGESFTTALKNKLAGIEAGAQVNVQPDWNAASGDPAFIKNKPTVPTDNTQIANGAGYITSYTVTETDVTQHQSSLALQANQISGLFSGNYDDLNNKPTIPTNNNQLSNGAGYTTKQGVMGTVVHGATASTSRPAGFSVVTWIGSVEPTNATDNDVWYDIST